jgi:hypothetical protein
MVGPTYSGRRNAANGRRVCWYSLGAAVVCAWLPSIALAQADSAVARDAYLDESARELVRLGRERRRLIDQSVMRYNADAQERISAGLRTLGRERLFYRREVASHIDWSREGPVRIQVTGAREIIPPVMRGAQIPEDLRSYMPHLAFDPVENDVFLRFDSTSLRHPLAPAAESHYQYKSGDTTTIRLPDGRSVQLHELVIIPRRDDVHLLTGSFWFEAETHAVVRAVFRPARAFDYDRDADEDDDDVPGFIKPIRAELRFITMEYGLYEFRWWMPRLIAAEGVLQMSVVTMPLRYERRYMDYIVEGDTTQAFASRDTVTVRPCRPGMQMTVNAGEESNERRERRRAARRARADSIAAARAAEPPDSAELERRRCRERFQVTIADSASLLTSETLPESAFGDDIELMTGLELAELEKELKQLPDRPWQLRAPSFALGLGGAGLLRYNRIESLSIGAKTQLDLGRLTIDGSARIGLADLEPNGELSITRETIGSFKRITAYRRLAAANPETLPLGIGNSVSALLFGRDDGEYYRALGVQLDWRPPTASSQWFGLRLYAEHQSAANTETDFSVRHLIDSDHLFRPNIAASKADQIGASLVLRTSHGFDPAAFRWGAEASVTAEAGTFEFIRPGVTLRAALPLGRLALAVETAAGTSFSGEPPVQSDWFLGGPATLRGYNGGVMHGMSYWRGRAELAGSRPAVRLTLFSDAGWAGPRAAFGTRDALISAGAGAAFLDGLVRLEVARALRRPLGWRADFYVSRGF